MRGPRGDDSSREGSSGEGPPPSAAPSGEAAPPSAAPFGADPSGEAAPPSAAPFGADPSGEAPPPSAAPFGADPSSAASSEGPHFEPFEADAGPDPSAGAPHEAAAAALLARGGETPRVGVVLGSGLGAVADAIEAPRPVAYDELPGFPRPHVAGHAGVAVLGKLAGVPVVVLQGRAHLYEGEGLEALRTPVRALHAAGAEILVLTNAAGSLRPEVGPGRLMVIADHINLTGANPLIGPNDDAIGPRFPSLRDAYDPDLRAELHAAASDIGVKLAEGVYLAVSGPSFETPAEIRAFRALGADAVGMSTVHEAIVARHAGLRMVAVSAISNLAEGLSDEPLSHEQTLRDAARAAGDLAAVLERFCRRLA